MALLSVLIWGGLIVGFAVWLSREGKRWAGQAQRRKMAKTSPFTKEDYDFFISAGMTKDQIEALIKKAQDNL